MTADDLIKNAHCGIVGINSKLEVSSGYDNEIAEAGAFSSKPDWLDEDEYDSMSRKEKRILADRMIERWNQYKKKAI